MNYPSSRNYPSETDNTSKYKFGAKMNYEAKDVIRLLARLEDVLTDGKFVFDG